MPDFGLNNQVSQGLPQHSILLLGNGKGLCNDVEYIAWTAQAGTIAQVHGDNAVWPHLIQRLCRHGVGKSTIYQQSSAGFYGRKYSGISATRPDSFSQWP